MRRKGTHAAVVWVGLVLIASAGCGRLPAEGSSIPDEADPANANGDAGGAADGGGEDPGDFTFPEDADPAVAELAFVEEELLVRTLPGAEPEDVEAAYAQTGVAVVETFPEIQTTVVSVDPDELVAAAAALSANPLFEALQKNYLYEPEQTPDDARFGSQDYLERVRVPEAWDITTGAADVVIAVLDTGVAGEHPDLASKLLEGRNTFNRTNHTEDVAGHGTSVAGVAGAASNNGIGVAGVSWASPILPVRVTNSQGRASTRAIAAGLVWAVNHGARVINVSFAPLRSDRTVLRAARFVRSAGGLVFISAGNDGRYSSARDNVNAIFVGATDASNRPAVFSSYGPFVDLVAPGTGIETTAGSGGYQKASGTSYSSPIAAGVAALVWAVRPELRPVTVEQLLAETAVDLGSPGRDDSFGAGLVDAGAAVAEALDIVEQDDHTAPLVDISSPEDGDSVSGVIRVSLQAADTGAGVADVVLSVDGRPFATDAAEPFRFALNTRRLAPGPHTLTCVATDAAGNSSEPATVRIVVGDGGPDSGDGGGGGDTIDPGVIINFPTEGTTVAVTVAIQATATDNAGLAQAQWLVDGVTKQTTGITGTQAVIRFVWDAGGYGQGTHTITVRVTDAAGNQTSARVRLVKQ